MAWIFKPDGTVMETPYWPSPGAWDLPHGSWGYPSNSGTWGYVFGSIWKFPRIEDVPKHIQAMALLLE